MFSLPGNMWFTRIPLIVFASRSWLCHIRVWICCTNEKVVGGNREAGCLCVTYWPECGKTLMVSSVILPSPTHTRFTSANCKFDTFENLKTRERERERESEADEDVVTYSTWWSVRFRKVPCSSDAQGGKFSMSVQFRFLNVRTIKVCRFVDRRIKEEKKGKVEPHEEVGWENSAERHSFTLCPLTMCQKISGCCAKCRSERVLQARAVPF